MPSGIYKHHKHQGLQKGHGFGIGNKYRLGKTPWNKGKKTGIVPPTAFKKGSVPWNKGKTHLQKEKHPMWKKDRSTLAKRQERNDSSYGEWRRLVWERDCFKCKINNKDCSGRLEAHHILSWSGHPELRYDVNNGTTLCHAHHPKKRAEEKRLSPYFMEMVSVTKE